MNTPSKEALEAAQFWYEQADASNSPNTPEALANLIDLYSKPLRQRAEQAEAREELVGALRMLLEWGAVKDSGLSDDPAHNAITNARAVLARHALPQ